MPWAHGRGAALLAMAAERPSLCHGRGAALLATASFVPCKALQFLSVLWLKWHIRPIVCHQCNKMVHTSLAFLSALARAAKNRHQLC